MLKDIGFPDDIEYFSRNNADIEQETALLITKMFR